MRVLCSFLSAIAGAGSLAAPVLKSLKRTRPVPHGDSVQQEIFRERLHTFPVAPAGVDHFRDIPQVGVGGLGVKPENP